jgi:hypothetical protein
LLAEMLGLLKFTEPPQFGVQPGPNPPRPLILERKGGAHCAAGLQQFVRGFEADANAGGAWSETRQVVRHQKKARTQYGADVVIPVMIHWVGKRVDGQRPPASVGPNHD